MSHHFRLFAVGSHLFAATFALLFIWSVFRTPHFITALQFVGPVMVILCSHFVWVAMEDRLKVGFAKRVFERSTKTSIGLVGMIVCLVVLLPYRAQSDTGYRMLTGALEIVLGSLFCLVIIALVLAAVTLPFFLLYVICRYISDKLGNNSKDKNTDSRLFDFGNIALALIALSAMSLEGLSSVYSFAKGNKSVAQVMVDAPSS